MSKKGDPVRKKVCENVSCTGLSFWLFWMPPLFGNKIFCTGS